jgi:hypothetical protein
MKSGGFEKVGFEAANQKPEVAEVALAVGRC